MSNVCCKKITDPKTLLEFLDSMSLDFKTFNSSVLFTTSALHMFVGILAWRNDCKNLQVKPYDNYGRRTIEVDYYPEDYLRVNLKLLFADRHDGTYHLSGFTRYAVDEDTTCMRRVEFPKVGVRLDRAVEINDFFENCTEELEPHKKQWECFE